MLIRNKCLAVTKYILMNVFHLKVLEGLNAENLLSCNRMKTDYKTSKSCNS